MPDRQEASYPSIRAATAARLGMTEAQVDEVLDVYLEESRKDKERRRESLKDNHVYQQWLAAKQRNETA